MQRYVNDVKSDISREMELDELRKLQSSVEEAARSIEQSVHEEVSATESQLNAITASATDPAPTPACRGFTDTASGRACAAAARRRTRVGAARARAWHIGPGGAQTGLGACRT